MASFLKQRLEVALAAVALIGLAGLTVFFVHDGNVAVLNPQGAIAEAQRDLLVLATGLSLIVIVPVYVLTFVFAWRYRAGNTKAKYRPDWDGNRWLELVWWAVPCLIILVLAVMAWKSSRDLDPFRAIDSDAKPVKIQVVALQWKWLFIYPEQDMATVNLVQFPEDRPVEFEITSDAPMNSFWIPQLGGQVYAMSGMRTKLHLIADIPGTYDGSSANLSGEGFAGMKFVARASTQEQFDAWVAEVKQSRSYLGPDEYKRLAQPSQNNPVAYYYGRDAELYDGVIAKYLDPDYKE